MGCADTECITVLYESFICTENIGSKSVNEAQIYITVSIILLKAQMGMSRGYHKLYLKVSVMSTSDHFRLINRRVS
jgi:hypothetical protein